MVQWCYRCKLMGKNVKNGNQPVVAINRRWQSTGGGNQPAVAINWQWQSTGSGNQPAVAYTNLVLKSLRVRIIVDQMLHMSAPNVCAVGDAVEIRNLIFEGKTWTVPLAGPANCQGHMLADNIRHPSYQQKNTHEH